MMTLENGMIGKKRGADGMPKTVTTKNEQTKNKTVITNRRYIRTSRTTKGKLVQQVRPLQNLYRTCTEIFKGPGTVPSPQDVEKLERILDNMKPEDVGLSSGMSFFNPQSSAKGPSSVKYCVIHQCKNFEVCMFFLPPNAVIPLHNHPGMTVFSKLLLGSMHVKSYDWVESYLSPDSKPSSQSRLAKMKANDVLTASGNTSVLYPTSGGNMHAFTAITPCAMLDVLGPPYCIEEGRDCTYYRDVPYSSYSDGTDKAKEEDTGSYGWLEEIEPPEDYRVDGIFYLGPQINERDV